MSASAESCAQCGKHGVSLIRCSRCWQASYCSSSCYAFLKLHREACTAQPAAQAKNLREEVAEKEQMTEPGRSFLLPLGSGPMNPLAAADLPPLGRDGPTGEAADNATIERILLDMAPLKETHDQHEAFRTRLAVCVVEVCGSQCRLETFGSTVSGFATRDSDLDFNLNPDPSEVVATSPRAPRLPPFRSSGVHGASLAHFPASSNPGIEPLIDLAAGVAA
ncbi:hypothetical protein T484DRAFT_3640859 [Baffinella frigidus]|nr:hypothetical protein T484DRAFT_3640859 [Cryptophyta sp. CCMP2293]